MPNVIAGKQASKPGARQAILASSTRHEGVEGAPPSRGPRRAPGPRRVEDEAGAVGRFRIECAMDGLNPERHHRCQSTIVVDQVAVGWLALCYAASIDRRNSESSVI